MSKCTGADIVAQSLARAGVKYLFSLSGNHIMPIYDSALDANLQVVHTRHEGAAVHMADAWGRLTGTPGIALLTGGPGHANGVGALYTALASESPLVLISGHAPLRELGMGSFQEMRQADMAAPSVKASWTAESAAGLGEDIARAVRIAASGRPGPVHVSLPFDLLEEKCDASRVPESEAFSPEVRPLEEGDCDAVLDLLSRAQRPLILTGGVMSLTRAQSTPMALGEATAAPVICMESPRGLNDPALGRLAGIVQRSDLIVLLGKQPDFTLRFGAPPAIAATCKLVVIDPEEASLQRARKLMGDRVVFAASGDSIATATRLVARAAGRKAKSRDWRDEVEAALKFRPAEWASVGSSEGKAVHPVTVGRAVQDFIDASGDAVFVSDGGEFGQWAQACVDAPARLINGPGGSIGSALPFAIAAKLARPHAQVVAMSGDGAAGFHLLELDTAVRAALPVTMVIGNDACWNAEHQIQLRTYGTARAHSCELLPTRYDQVAAGLGAHGELVTTRTELPAALARAAASGKPACLNVMIERLPAPTYNPPPSGSGQ
jgi:acetolactate synthase-1/2/3 large subunit